MNDNDYIAQQLKEEEKNKKFKKITEKDAKITDEGNEDNLTNKIGELLINFALAIMTMTIIGLSELFSPDWEWGIYLTSSFWIGYLLTQSASWFARIWIYITRLRHYENTDKEYLKSQNELQKFIDKDFQEPFIEDYANADDLSRKERAWKNKQKRKIIKVANKFHITNVLPFISDIDSKDIEKTSFELNTDKQSIKWFKYDFSFRLRKRIFNYKVKRYNSKLNRILKTLTKDWIDSNLETTKVKYNKVSRTILTSGYVSKKDDSNTPNYKKNSSKIFLKYTIPSFIFISIFMFLIVPLRGELNNSASAWFQFITKLMIVFISGALMWYLSHEMFNATSKKSLNERVSTTNNYAKKRFKTQNKVSKEI